MILILNRGANRMFCHYRDPRRTQSLTFIAGNMSYLQAATRAAKVLYTARSPLGLVGRSANVHSGTYTDTSATIAAQTDSFYEYLLKGYLMFGEEEYLDMFATLYASLMHHMSVSKHGMHCGQTSSVSQDFSKKCMFGVRINNKLLKMMTEVQLALCSHPGMDVDSNTMMFD